MATALSEWWQERAKTQQATVPYRLYSKAAASYPRDVLTVRGDFNQEVSLVHDARILQPWKAQGFPQHWKKPHLHMQDLSCHAVQSARMLHKK